MLPYIIMDLPIFLSDNKDIRKEMNDLYQDLFSEEEVDLEAQNWFFRST